MSTSVAATRSYTLWFFDTNLSMESAKSRLVGQLAFLTRSRFDHVQSPPLHVVSHCGQAIPRVTKVM